MEDRTLIFVNRTRVPDMAYAELRAIWQGDYGNVHVIPTERPGEIHPFIREMQPKNVFIVGGDGSENEALGPALKQGFTLGIIPHGTGNDHATALGFPNTLKKLLERQDEKATEHYLIPFLATANGSQEYVRKVDVGAFTINRGKEHYFANSLGTGYFAEVNHAAQAYNGFNKPYLKIALQQRRSRAKRGPDTILLVTNGEKTEAATAVNLDLLIGNYFGDHKHLNPYGRIDDGSAELFMLDSAKRTAFWPNMINVLMGSNLHLTNRHLDYRTGIRELEAVFEEPQTVQYDGESMTGARELYVRILPQALPMVTNKQPTTSHNLFSQTALSFPCTSTFPDV